MFKVTLLSLILFISFNFYSQCNAVLINSSTNNFTVNNSSITPCLNQATFTVNMENVSPFYMSNMVLTIDLPSGINYIASSSSNATETNISNLNQPVFSLSDIGESTSNNNTLSFSIDIDATCELQTFLDAGGVVKNEVTILADLTNNGNTINCNLTHSSQPYGASVPNLSITGITEQSHNGTIGETFSRCISIINGGSGGLSSFSLEDTHGAGITVSSVDVGTVSTSGLTELIVLNGADFSTIGNNDNIFDPGETIIICETVNVIACVGTASNFKYYWGCNGSVCQELTDGANVIFPGEVPDLKTTIWNNYLGNANTGSTNYNSYPATNFTYSGCFDDGSQFKSRLTYVNQGTGTAYNIKTLLEGGNNWGGYGHGLDTSSMVFKYNSSIQTKTIQNSIHRSYSYGTCLPNESIGVTEWMIDSVAPGDTVSLEWSYFICIDNKNCSGRMHNLHWRYTTDYENACSQPYNIVRTSGSRVVYYTQNMILDQSPGTMFNGDVGGYSFINQTTDFFIPRNVSNDQFRYKLVVPSCVSVSNFRIIRPSDGVVFTPSSTTVDGDTVEFIYTDLTTPWLSNTTIDFDLTMSCSGACASGGYPVSLETFYTPDMGNTCELMMGCKTTTVNIVCGLLCPGIQFNQYSLERTNYGLADNDNDGIADVAGTLNLSSLRLDRLVYGDTLQILYGGNISNPSDDVWSYVYATTELAGGGSYFTPEGSSSLKIYDASTGIYHTSNALLPTTYVTVSTSRTFTQEIDYLSLVYDNALPGGYHLSDNDSIFVVSNFIATTNNAWNVASISAISNFYATSIQNPVNDTDKFGCPELNRDIQLYGYNHYNSGGNSYSVNSCNQVSLWQSYYMSIGPWFSGPGKNRFPNEFRYFSHPEYLNVELPDEYTFVSARFYCQRQQGTTSSSTYGTTHAGGSGYYNIIPDASLSTADSLVFKLGDYFGPDLTNDSITFPDETFYGSLNVVLEPNCKVQGDITKRIKYHWEFFDVEQWQDNVTRTNTNYWADTVVTRTDEFISYDKPKLLLQSNLISQNIASNTAIWNISITNNSNTSDASNTWFGIPTIGTVVADSIFDVTSSTMLIPSVNGVFQMGGVSASQTNNYTIYTHINGCNSDSIVVYHGWDCVGYPVDIASYPCTPLKTTLYITPLMPELSNYVSMLGSDTIGLCDTAHFELKIIDFQLGSAFNLITSINVSTGMVIEPGSCYIKYPESGTFVSIPDPTNTSGNNYEWDVSAIESTIGSVGLSGVLDQSKNKYYIRFNCLTDCDYTSGSRVTCLTTGSAKCGRSFSSNVGVANQVFIGDALPPYEANIKINTTYITPCLGNTPIELQIVNRGPLVFGANDSIAFRLDNGISYVGGSFLAIQNSPTNGTPTIFNNNGIDELSWKLLAGVAVGDTTIFSFTINGLPSDLECGVLQLGAQITTYGGAVCSTTNSFCNIDIATADTLKNIFIYKGYLDVSNSVSSYSVPNAPTGETGNISFDIFNSGETISTGTETIIQYYQDTDNDGVYSVGDTYITNDTIQNQLPANTNFNYTGTIDIPAGLGCKLIAVIDTSLNPCTCTPAQILINLPLISPTFYDTICSGSSVQVGLAPINTYNYSWNPVTNIDNSTIAQPNYSPSINYPATTSFELVRTIDRGSCFAKDTVNVLVYSNPQSNAGQDQNLCNINNTNLTGNQPLGTSTGLWTIDGSHAQPSTATFADATVETSNVSGLQEGVYQFVWTVSNGTCTPVSDTVIINVFDTPTSTAGADDSLCNIYTYTMSGNTPLGTATGLWSIDASYIQPNGVNFSDATSNVSNISNLQEGVYQFVWTVSNGSCTPARDTIRLSVFDTPTSSAGLDDSLCNVYTYVMSGNQPLGTATGLWTMDAAYTQPSTVSFSDATSNVSNISNLQEGVYQFIWTVSNGSCTPARDTIRLSIFDTPTSNAGLDDSLCNVYTYVMSGNLALGTATGLWTMDATHIQPSVVTFSDATSNVSNISNLQEGVYQFVWTVINGSCTPASDTIRLSVFDTPTSNAGIEQQLCSVTTSVLEGNQPVGTATGLWTMDPTFTSAPNTLTFTDATLYNTAIGNLVEGTYRLKWTVINGSCSDAISYVKINVYNQPTSTAGIDDSLCNVFDYNLAGNPPLGTAMGVWIEDGAFNNPSSVVFNDMSAYNTNVSGLVEGDYQFIWILSNGSCSPSLDTVRISVFNTPVSTAGLDDSLCNVYTYTMNGNQPLGTSTGLWTMDATHTQPSVVTFSDATSNTSNISNLQEGIYQFVWTVSNGTCNPVSDTISLSIFDTPISMAGADDSLCNIYTYTMNGNLPLGTSTGLWTMDATHTQPSAVTFLDATSNVSNISSLQEGVYQFVWTVSNGSCTPAGDTIVLSVFDTPTATAGLDDSLCNVYTYTMNGNLPLGTATGLWTMDATYVQPSVVTFADATSNTSNISNLQEGIYKLVWTVSNGSCTSASDTMNLNIFNTPVSNAGVDQNLCSIYTTDLTANLPAGTSTGFWMMQPVITQPSIVSFNNATLNNTSISNLQEGTYKLLWIVSNGMCTPDIDTVVINVYDQPIVNAGLNDSLCSIYSYTLNGNEPIGTATGLWTIDGSVNQPSVANFDQVTDYNTNVDNLQEGTYSLTWTLSNGTCNVVSDNVIIDVYDQPTANVESDKVICDIGITNLVGDAPIGRTTGLWGVNSLFNNPGNVVFTNPTSGETNVSYLLDGEYQFVWTLSNGSCPSSTDTIRVTRFPKPMANFIQLNSEVCTYECVDLSNTSIALPPFSIASVQWSIDTTSFSVVSVENKPTLCMETPGEYNVAIIATSSNGCTDTLIKEALITVLETPVAGFSHSPTNVLELEEVVITNESQNATLIEYDFGDGSTSLEANPMHIYDQNGTYVINQYVSNTFGCVDTAFTTILIGEKEFLFVPNGFTPNGDGKNDIFLPSTHGMDSEINKYHLLVFDRWGQMIYESYELSEGWNGTHLSKDLPLGVYVWKIYYNLKTEVEQKELIGNVTLVR